MKSIFFILFSLQSLGSPQKTLFETISEGDLQATKSLIEKGEDVNAINQKGETPLILAVLKRKEKIMSLLLEKKANPNQTTKEGMTALMYASRLQFPKACSNLTR